MRVDALRPAVSAVRCGIMYATGDKVREIVAKVAGDCLRSFRALPISRDNDILVLRDHLKQISASDFCRMQPLFFLLQCSREIHIRDFCKDLLEKLFIKALLLQG